MKKLIIFGTTAFSRLLKEIVEEDSGVDVAAYCVNRSYLDGVDRDVFAPVVAFEELDELFGKGQFEVLITSGYTRMNKNREKLFRECDERGYAIASFVHSTTRLNGAALGRGNIIMGNCVVNKFSSLGDGNILVDGTTIGHDSSVGSFNFFAGATTGGLVTVGDNCFFGIKSVVCNDVKVGSFTLLGAGVVLSENSEGCSAIMPARNRTIKMDEDSIASMLI